MFTEGAACSRCEGGAYFNAVLHDCFPTRRQSAAYATALWSHRYLLRLERRVARWVAPSRFISDRLVSWGIDPAIISTVPCTVPIPDRVGELGEHGLFLGRLRAEKGVAVLLRALAEAGDPPFRVVGDGPDRSDLESLARELGLSRTVFTGHLERDEANRELLAGRYVVAPSLSDENAPLAVAEALAAGRPVVASRTGGTPELLTGERGLVFEPGDVSGLADLLAVVTRDRALCERMGAKAQEYARANLSSAAHIAKLEDVYTRTVSGQRGLERVAG